jgi:hypothetical protein
VAQRKVIGGWSNRVTNKTHLFRSYNHTERFEKEPKEFNPQTLGRVNIKIWEACLATSAAPFYFRNMSIGADVFLDGGAGDNNPSTIAWNEAKWMSCPGDPARGRVIAMVSIGTGDKAELDLFGNQKSLSYIIKSVKHGLHQITNTKSADEQTRNLANASGATYFRFSVKPMEDHGGNDGLASVKLSEVKKRRQEGWQKWTRDKAEMVGHFVVSAVRRSDSFASSKKEPPERPEWYKALLTDATADGDERKKGAFKPDKYHYTTYDTIFDRTREYCEFNERSRGEDVAGVIEACATELLRYARLRHRNEPERWKCFVSHPHPDHDMFLPSEIRPRPR